MKKLAALLLMFSSITSFSQNPAIIKNVGGDVTEPKNKDQEIWQNNQWNGLLFYQGTGTPLKLCVTDGTSAGTKLIKDINADLFQFTIPAQNFIYIITERSSGTFPNLLANVEIWKSDGTAAGTLLVKALPSYNPFSGTAYLRWTSDKQLKRNFSVIGDVMYFVGYDATNGSELWRTDGTDAGTFILKDIRPGTGNSNASSFCAIGSVVYFSAAATGFDQKLWKTDGTSIGTMQVAVPEPFFASPYVGKVNNKMIFYANNTVNGLEPWVSDGTASGTFMLADINAGATGSNPASEQNLHLRFNNKYCFFIANKTTGGKSLWRSDGTIAGTIQLTPDGLIAEENFSGGGYSSVDNNGIWWIGANNTLYFSDGTVAGTRKITSSLSNALYMVNYKGAAWFHARVNNVTDEEPWRSDGTPAGTNRALNVQPGTIGCYPYGFFTLNNKLYFFSNYSPSKNLYQYTGDMTYNGSTAGGRWSDSTNWNSLMPPGITDSVYINSGTPNALNITGNRAYAGALIVQSGAGINLAAASDSLIINNSITSTSPTTFSGSGALVLRNANNNTVVVQNAITTNHLSVQSPSILLNNNATVNNALTLSNNGKLSLSKSNLLLAGTSSTISASATNYIVTDNTGKLLIDNVGTGARVGNVTFPIGTNENYTPVVINNAGTADQFGARVQEGISNLYSGESASGGMYTTNAVNATWLITEANAGGSNASITLQWNPSQELPGFNRTVSQFGHYMGGTWMTAAPAAATGSGPYSLTGTGITSFSPFGILNSGAVLPVNSFFLSLRKSERNILLSWSNPVNTATITIERSNDGSSFQPISVQGALVNNYADDLIMGKIYYRLKAASIDGRFTYSNIVWVNNFNKSSTQIYPTIFTSNFFVQHNDAVNILLQLVNSNGQLQLMKQLANGTNVVDASHLSAGVYYYKLIQGPAVSSGKLIKQ